MGFHSHGGCPILYDYLFAIAILRYVPTRLVLERLVGLLNVHF